MGWPESWWLPGMAPDERAALDGRTRPGWADIVEAAVDGTVATEHGGAVAALAAWGRAHVAKRTGHRFVAAETVTARFGEQLTTWLRDIAARTCTWEFGDATEAVPADRSRTTALCTDYPVLARLLGETARLAVEAHVELLTRFAADRPAIVGTLLDGADPGAMTRIEARRGDPHRGGRSVSIVEFADGRRVVYRPRDITSHLRFAELVGWLVDAVPGTELRVPAAVAGDGYGWLEFIEDRPPTRREDAERYTFRLGLLLALLHAVRAVDIHHENVIADGDQPVLVDVEAIYHPALPHLLDRDPASRALKASVYRTGLLPQFVVGAAGISDISGSGRKGHRQDDPADHTAALLAGFRRGYDAIMHNRQEFAALARGCADVEARVVIRPTRQYAGLLGATTHPNLLRDAGDRDRALADALAGGPFGGDLVRHELTDLWTGDIPLFLERPDSRDVLASDGARLPGLFERTGLDDVLATLAGMSEIDRRDQGWIVSAAMATRRSTSHDDAAPLPGHVTGTAADPQRLLTAACAIADRIVSRSMADRGRVNWLGLELVDERQWLMMPMGAGLANGYVGVALFLAQLGEISGIARYRQVARDALTAVPELLATLAAQPAMVAAIGCGGLHGLGGIAFGLARIAYLQADAEVRDLAGTAVELAASAAAAPGPLGWATGTAGCLAAMTAVHAELGLPAAARLATSCADRLAGELADRPAPREAGFADGAAGIAWALRTCSPVLPGGATPGHVRVAQAATDSVTAADSERTTRFGWCAGLAGLVLGRPLDDTGAWTRALVDRALLRDLSLCHGEFGIADVVVATTDDQAARRHYAGLALDAIDRYGPRCGTPEGVSTPGLLTGLAGIGYGLLRLGFGNVVPSALLLGTSTAAPKEPRRRAIRRPVAEPDGGERN